LEVARSRFMGSVGLQPLEAQGNHEATRTSSCCICNTNLSGCFWWFIESFHALSSWHRGHESPWVGHGVRTAPIQNGSLGTASPTLRFVERRSASVHEKGGH
jgi:hypothetical protein